MKPTASLLILLACAGCSTQTASVKQPTPPSPSIQDILMMIPQSIVTNPPAAMIGTSHDSVAQTPQLIRLTWTENYVAGFTNEQTEIDESTDLTNWATCFTGATNECWIQEIYPFAFYRASNFLP